MEFGGGVSIDVAWLREEFPNHSSLQPIDGGGQKWVIKSDHEQYGTCVIKILKPGKEAYLDREIEAVRRVDSDRIPTILETGRIDSQFGPLVFLVERFVGGETLEKVLERGPLSKHAVLALTCQLLEAARDAEKVDVVHRDIKPANVILESTDSVWLLDFGIARVLDLESYTPTAATKGPHTPGYGAPEQFRNRKRQIDGRTDLFSIGITVFEAATGINPFTVDGGDLEEILHRVETLPTPPLDVGWDAAGQLNRLIQSLTQKYPARRPRDCDSAYEWAMEVARELEEA